MNNILKLFVLVVLIYFLNNSIKLQFLNSKCIESFNPSEINTFDKSIQYLKDIQNPDDSEIIDIDDDRESSELLKSVDDSQIIDISDDKIKQVNDSSEFDDLVKKPYLTNVEPNKQHVNSMNKYLNNTVDNIDSESNEFQINNNDELLLQQEHIDSESNLQHVNSMNKYLNYTFDNIDSESNEFQINNKDELLLQQEHIDSESNLQHVNSMNKYLNYTFDDKVKGKPLMQIPEEEEETVISKDEQVLVNEPVPIDAKSVKVIEEKLNKITKEADIELVTAKQQLKLLEDKISNIETKSENCNRECVDEYIAIDEYGIPFTEPINLGSHQLPTSANTASDNNVGENTQKKSQNIVELLNSLNESIKQQQDNFDKSTENVELVYSKMMDKLSNQSDINLQLLDQLKDSTSKSKKKLEVESKKIKNEAIKEAVIFENKCKQNVTNQYKKDQIATIQKRAMMDLKLNGVNKLLNELKTSLSDLQQPQNELETRLQSECKQKLTPGSKLQIDEMLRSGKPISSEMGEEMYETPNESDINTVINSINKEIDSTIISNENECIGCEDESKPVKCKNPVNINVLYPHIKSPI